MILYLFRRHKLAVLLTLLLALNAVRYWPRKHGTELLAGDPDFARPPDSMEGPPGSGAFPEPSPAMRQRMEAALRRMPEGQRKAVKDRMEVDRVFFASLKNLPEEQRRQRVEEHFAQSPPPGFNGGSPATSGPGGHDGPNGGIPGPGRPGENGGPGSDGKAFQIPPPAVRRALDQHVADAQKHTEGT